MKLIAYLESEQSQAQVEINLDLMAINTFDYSEAKRNERIACINENLNKLKCLEHNIKELKRIKYTD